MTPQQDGKSTVLIVDDEAANLYLLTSILEPHYRVRAAPSGAHALRAMASEPLPDAVLLDIMMPDIDGYQVLARLKDDLRTRAIPVIFITALNAAEDEERGLLLGASDYIAKPFSPAVVLARLRVQLELKQAHERLDAQNRDLEAEVARRIEEKRAVEVQLLQADKMASIGLLSAGIVHEINSPVGYVGTNLDVLAGYVRDLLELIDAYRAAAQALDADTRAALLALEQAKDLGFLREDAGHVLKESGEGIRRVRDIVDSLKAFARRDDGEWQVVDLHPGLESTLRVVWNQLKYHCTVVKDYGELPPVRCMPSQLNQVFLNLLVNAAQAIEGQGTITLRTGVEGGQVWVEVADTGKGIPPDRLPHIFEPFYTTKPAGQGTGLGLSLSADIVARHGGRIQVGSEVGQGTTFRVILPIWGAASAEMNAGR